MLYSCRMLEDKTIEVTLADREPTAGSLLLYEFEAATWEEAMAVHHIRMGWRPYVPEGEAEVCPVHGGYVVFYPDGSGTCWKCGTEH